MSTTTFHRRRDELRKLLRPRGHRERSGIDGVWDASVDLASGQLAATSDAPAYQSAFRAADESAGHTVAGSHTATKEATS